MDLCHFNRENTLPKEISVTPLLYRILLKNGVSDWEKKIVEAEKNVMHIMI